MGYSFLLDMLIALGVIAGFGLLFAFVSLLVIYIIDRDEIAQNQSGRSTTLGNALLVMHSIFEPGRKPMSEQIVWVKKRRTPAEKAVLGLTELEYDRIRITGYKFVVNKKYSKK